MIGKRHGGIEVLTRRTLLGQIATAGAMAIFGLRTSWGQSVAEDWLARWEGYILGTSKRRYCDTETGEEIGWLISPFLNGFYYGYLATGQERWVAMLVDWADAWIGRQVKDPDGFPSWPKDGGTSTTVMPDLYIDNQLGEAMALRPIVLMASVILRTPSLQERYGQKANGYLEFAGQIFRKWDARGCWRQVQGGGVWVVPPFGIDKTTWTWTDGYQRRFVDGFTMPANKQNLIASWLIAMYQATSDQVYLQRAKAWWQVMRSRMRVRQERFLVWNYWDPAGPWDYKPDGSPRHWVGVHPNGGYYAIDVQGIVTAYEHGLVFSRQDLEMLIATNRDFMWDGNLYPATFRRIDGGPVDQRWKDSPGLLWTALVRYDQTLRRVFEANHRPASWSGLATTPWYVALSSGRLPGPY